MTESESAIFRSFSRAEIELYRGKFGPDAFPHWIPPAETGWPDKRQPLARYVETHDPRPRFDVPGVGMVRGERRLAEVTKIERKQNFKATITARQWFKQKKPTRVKRLRSSAA